MNDIYDLPLTLESQKQILFYIKNLNIRCYVAFTLDVKINKHVYFIYFLLVLIRQ